MAIRTDFTIDWNVSPRVIIVAAPSTECTMQDLLDTLRWLEAQSNAMDNPSIVGASGKEPLGGGTKVGITVSLQNAVIGFEARDGLPLVFDPSSETMINTWTVCNLQGGNLVAFDTDGVTTIEPIYPTAFVSISKTSSSSATLQEQDALNYSSYGLQASLDVTSGLTGVEYPAGNQEFPVNNAPDAVTICKTKGFHQIGVRGDYDFIAGDDISNLRVVGVSHTTTNIDLGYDAVCSKTIFTDVSITGILDGDSELNNCIVRDMVYFNGHIHGGSLAGIIWLGGASPANIKNATMLDTEHPVIIDCGGSGQDIIITGYVGNITIRNLTGPSKVGLQINGGTVIIDSTCTAGGINIAGNADITDNSNGALVDISRLLAHSHEVSAIPQAVWDHVI